MKHQLKILASMIIFLTSVSCTTIYANEASISREEATAYQSNFSKLQTNSLARAAASSNEETLTWDISATENDSVTATLSGGVLTISGTGNMKNWNRSDSIPWDSYKSVIKSVMIGDGVTSIENFAFDGCSSLSSITIPNSVTSIGDFAFNGCSSLSSITIPNSVIDIGNFAFEYCSKLSSITIPNSVTSIGSRAFSACSSLSNISVDSNNTKYTSENGILFDKAKTKIVRYPVGKKDTTYTIPNSVIDIGNYAFDGCSSLSNIHIPEKVTRIKSSAFDGCSSLTSIHIPDGVTSIEDETFRSCSSLSSITIPNSVTSIGNAAFLECSSLSSIIIPNSVIDIGNYAFEYCSRDLIIYCCSNEYAKNYCEQNNFKVGHTYGSWTTTKQATCTEVGEQERTCSTCHHKETKTIPALEHDEVIDLAVDATCTKTGKTEGKHCSRCNAILKEQTVIPATGHTYGSWTTTKQATCTEVGEQERTCGTCHHKETKTVLALGHAEVIDEAVAATCTTAGKAEGKHCSRCNTILKEQTVISAIGHIYESWIITKQATCTEAGEQIRICSTCHQKETKTIPALGHQEVIDPAVAATCTTEGKTEGKHCSRCRATLIAQTAIPATGHTYGNWTTTKQATCTEAGEQTRTCSTCQNKETQVIAALGHEEVIDPAVAVTCTTTGKTAGKHCSRCKIILEKQEVIPATGSHTYENWITIKQATCTEAGEQTRTCSTCQNKETQVIAALGHQEVIDEAVAATCTTAGKTEGRHCSRCGKIIIEQVGIPAAGHTYGHWKTTKQATCTEAGKKEKTCEICNHAEIQTIPATGHTYGKWIIDKKPTKEEEGHQYRECTKCGTKEEKTIEKIDDSETTITTSYDMIEKDGKRYIIIQPNIQVKEVVSGIETNKPIQITDKTGNQIEDTNLVFTGAKIKIEDADYATIVVKGDIDGNGIINFTDIITINNYRLQLIKLKEASILAGDINQNGTIEFVNDILTINNYRLGLIKTL